VCGFSLQEAGGAGGEQCQIDKCWDQYTLAQESLETSGRVGDSGTGVVSDHEALCVVLRTYMSCIRSAKNSSRACQGDFNYYYMRSGFRKKMNQHNCTMNGPTVDTSVSVIPQPPRQVPYQCQYHGENAYQHCGLFGDPHLRTFSSEFQTCKVKGAWPLINNDYLTVQVTNDPVLGGNGEATATSKVSIKAQFQCTKQAIFVIFCVFLFLSLL
jgi:RGM family protein